MNIYTSPIILIAESRVIVTITIAVCPCADHFTLMILRNANKTFEMKYNDGYVNKKIDRNTPRRHSLRCPLKYMCNAKRYTLFDLQIVS